MCGVNVCDVARSVNCWYYIGTLGVRFVRLAVGDCYVLIWVECARDRRVGGVVYCNKLLPHEDGHCPATE